MSKNNIGILYLAIWLALCCRKTHGICANEVDMEANPIYQFLCCRYWLPVYIRNERCQVVIEEDPSLVGQWFEESGIFRYDIGNQDVAYFKREKGIQGLDIYEYMLQRWQVHDYTVGGDYVIYSSELDLINGQNTWVCPTPYNPVDGIGFPGTCHPNDVSANPSPIYASSTTCTDNKSIQFYVCSHTLSASPTLAPTASPVETVAPINTKSPTAAPTKTPTKNPTSTPSVSPTEQPTLNPSNSPTMQPTTNPSVAPTRIPTKQPTEQPTANPTSNPSVAPTGVPTKQPTKQPTSTPTSNPSVAPTGIPTKQPTKQPSASPTEQPSVSPSVSPTKQPSASPNVSPTKQPSASPNVSPTEQPSASPTKVNMGQSITDAPTDSPLNTGCTHIQQQDFVGGLVAQNGRTDGITTWCPDAENLYIRASYNGAVHDISIRVDFVDMQETLVEPCITDGESGMVYCELPMEKTPNSGSLEVEFIQTSTSCLLFAHTAKVLLNLGEEAECYGANVTGVCSDPAQKKSTWNVTFSGPRLFGYVTARNSPMICQFINKNQVVHSQPAHIINNRMIECANGTEMASPELVRIVEQDAGNLIMLSHALPRPCDLFRSGSGDGDVREVTDQRLLLFLGLTLAGSLFVACSGTYWYYASIKFAERKIARQKHHPIVQPPPGLGGASTFTSSVYSDTGSERGCGSGFGRHFGSGKSKGENEVFPSVGTENYA